jgi:hypothetical protein
MKTNTLAAYILTCDVHVRAHARLMRSIDTEIECTRALARDIEHARLTLAEAQSDAQSET